MSLDPSPGELRDEDGLDETAEAIRPSLPADTVAGKTPTRLEAGMADRPSTYEEFWGYTSGMGR